MGDEAVITGRERIVHDDLNALLRESAKLVEEAKSIGELTGKRITTASSLGGFIQPHCFSGNITIPERRVEGLDGVGSIEPIGRERLIDGEFPAAAS